MAQPQWRSPLAKAIQVGDTVAFAAQVDDERVDVGARNGEALQAAATSGNAALLRSLLALEEVEPAALRNVSLLALAARHGHTAAISVLLEDGRACSREHVFAAITDALAHGHRTIAESLLQRLPVQVRTLLSAAMADDTSTVGATFGCCADVGGSRARLAAATLGVAAASGSLGVFVLLQKLLAGFAATAFTLDGVALADASDQLTIALERAVPVAMAAGHAQLAVLAFQKHATDDWRANGAIRDAAAVAKQAALRAAVLAGRVPALAELEARCRMVHKALKEMYSRWCDDGTPEADAGLVEDSDRRGPGHGFSALDDAGADDDAVPRRLSAHSGVCRLDLQALAVAAAAAGRHEAVDWLIETVAHRAEALQAEHEAEATVGAPYRYRRAEDDERRAAYELLALQPAVVAAAAVYVYARAGNRDQAARVRGCWPRGRLADTRLLATAHASGHLEAGDVASAQGVAARAPVDWVGGCLRSAACSVPSPEAAAALGGNAAALRLLPSLAPLMRDSWKAEAQARCLRHVARAAARAGNADALAAVLHACPDAITPNAAFIAAARGHMAALDVLLRASEAGKLTDDCALGALAGAARAGRPRLTAFLLRQGCVRRELRALLPQNRGYLRYLPPDREGAADCPRATEPAVLELLLAEPLLTPTGDALTHAADEGAGPAVQRLLGDERAVARGIIEGRRWLNRSWWAVLGHHGVLTRCTIPHALQASILPAVADAAWARRREAVTAWCAAAAEY